MKRTNRWFSWFLVAAVLIALSIGVGSAQAQANPIAFGVVAGATIPTGDFADGVNTGYHAGALLEWTGAAPIGVRADAVYHRFGFEGGGDANFSIIAVTLNAVFSFPMEGTTPMRPYVIAGGGYYHGSCNNCGGTGESDDKFGVNGGAGISIPLTGFSVFGEARFHHIFTDDSATQMVPISVGVMFRP